MKIEITQKGAFGRKGDREVEHEVGEIVTVKGDEIPSYLIGKARPIGKVAVTNPKEGAVPGGGEKSPEREALEARCKELGIAVHPQAKDETLTAKIAEAEAEAAKKAE